MKVNRAIVLFPALILIAGCRTAGVPQGLDQATLAARAAIEQKYPDVPAGDLRLLSILPLSHTVATNRTYMVVFEQVSSIQVTTRDGARERTVRQLEAHVTDGKVTSVGESRNVFKTKARQ